MEARDLDRIRFTTQHFNNLQGFRYTVPLGLALLGLLGPPLLRAVLVLGALVLMLGARRYYRETFGEVESQPDVIYPVAVFRPAGPAPLPGRLDRFQPTPMGRHLLLTLTLAVLLFSLLQWFRPHILIQGNESLGQHPRVFLEDEAPVMQAGLNGYRGCSMRSPATVRALFAQAIYLLSGAFFLGVWIWRERRGSQSLHGLLALLLLGLAALGTSLGFHVQNAGMARIIDLVLPVLVFPGIALFFCGSSLVLAGLSDHWQLVRGLGVPSREEES